MIVPATRAIRPMLLTWFLLLFLVVAAYAQTGDDAITPVVYLNFNEGSGITALDASGNGNAGTLHNVTRVESGGCGGALVFNRLDNYVSIPYRSANHPEGAITVSTWFFVDSFDPQDLISTGHNGGYRLGFADGNDLWWTVNLRVPARSRFPSSTRESPLTSGTMSPVSMMGRPRRSILTGCSGTR